MITFAGSGGHALAMYGSGEEFEAKMMTPGGDVIRRHRDGTIKIDMKVDRVTHSDGNHRAARSISEEHETTRHDVKDRRAIKHKDKSPKAIEYIEKKQEGVKYSKRTRRHIK